MESGSAWVTTSTILQRLQDFEDRSAWDSFVDRFRGSVVGYARRRGLSEEDSADAAQETLTAFAQAYRAHGYDPACGRLSSWLFGFARKQVLRALARRGRQPDAAASAAWSQLSAPDAVDAEWREAWERSVFEHALNAARGEFQPATWRVFEMLVLEGRDVDAACGDTGLSRNAVYIAKHRVLTRVQELVRDCDEVA